MKAAIHVSNSNHQNIHAKAMAEGLKRHGIAVEFFRDNPGRADFLVFWGWRKAKLWRQRGHECLIMERGYIGDRFSWTSLGWNGLNGRAQFNPAFDTGERLNKYYGDLIQPWQDRDGYALIMGQVPGDAALIDVDIMKWVENTHNELVDLGYDVRYRHHPLAHRKANPPYPSVDGNLSEAMRDAKFVVTYNSNTGVDSVVRGIPAVTLDIGAMAWSMTSHDLNNPIVMPDRNNWLVDLSWKQWKLSEIESGEFWPYIKPSELAARNYTALVIGGGPHVWEEVEEAFNSYKIDYVIAINNSIQDFPGRIDMAITLHPVKMAGWLSERSRKGYPIPKDIVCHKYYDGFTKHIPYLWPDMKYSGSSGLFAVKAALEIAGADKVILAGIPMNTDAHYYKQRTAKWTDCGAFLPAWKSALPIIKDKVRSFSGYTEKLLGKPTKEWLNG